MDPKVQFWEGLKQKYESKNQTLQNREMLLRHRIEAMQTVIEGPSGMPFRVPSGRPPPERNGFFNCLWSILPTYPKSKAPQDIPTKEQSADGDCFCSSDPVIEDSSSCDCSVEIPLKQPEPTGQMIDGVPINWSLKSLDFFYLNNLQELAKDQKTLNKNIVDLENKVQIYEQVFKERDAMVSPPCPVECNVPSKADEKSGAELKLENFLLKSELKDMRLEVRQYLERMEGPMQYKIESEKYKVITLEHKLEEAAKQMADLQDFYQKEINTIKMELCTANTNIYNLTSANDNLNGQLQERNEQCSQLEDELIRQKISEAGTLKKLKACLDARRNGQEPPKECNLHEIARELSRVLKECEPCGACMNLPEDLTEAAKLLKNLTDMIDTKLKKAEGCCEEATPTRDIEEEAPEDKIEIIPEEVEEIIVAPPPEPPVIQVPTSSKCGECGTSSKKKCNKCNKGPKADEVDQIWPVDFKKMVHHVKSVQSTDVKKSCTAKALSNTVKVEDNFPYKIDTEVEVLDKTPNGVHVTTTVTKSGTLEVITEGPEGVIETTLQYTNSGNVEVITEILEFGNKNKLANLTTIKASSHSSNKQKSVELKDSKSEPSTSAQGSDTECYQNPDCLCKKCAKRAPPPPEVNPNCQCSVCPVLLDDAGAQPGEPSAPPEEYELV